MAQKDLNISLLCDYYGNLLDEKHLECLSMFYNEDLSLSEIAQQIGISRQGVRDRIKHAEEKLREFEDKLGLVKKSSEGKKLFVKLSIITEGNKDAEAVIDKLAELYL